MQRIAFFGLVSAVTLLASLFSGCSVYNRNAEGVKYFGQARYNDAMTAFQSALSADPNNPDIYYNIASTYHQSAKVSLQTGQPAVAQQQYDEAVRNYQLCLSKDPNHTATYRGLASLYMECANAEAAFNLLLAWFQANPVAVDPKIELARLYQEYAQIRLVQGSQEDYVNNANSAAKLLNQALTVDPNNFRVYRALGYMKEQGNDFVGAISDYRRSLQLNPNQNDLATRITALEQGGGYTLPTGTVTYPTTGATVYGSTRTASGLGSSPF